MKEVVSKDQLELATKYLTAKADPTNPQLDKKELDMFSKLTSHALLALADRYAKDNQDNNSKAMIELHNERAKRARPVDPNTSTEEFDPKTYAHIPNLNVNSLQSFGVLPTRLVNSKTVNCVPFLAGVNSRDQVWLILKTVDTSEVLAGIHNLEMDEFQELCKLAKIDVSGISRTETNAEKAAFTNKIRDFIMPVKAHEAVKGYQYASKVKVEIGNEIQSVEGFRKGEKNSLIGYALDYKKKTYAKLYEEQVTESLNSNSIAVDKDNVEF